MKHNLTIIYVHVHNEMDALHKMFREFYPQKDEINVYKH